MRALYFSHSYAPEDRRFNEYIWRLLRAKDFHAWIDTGLEGGWQGNKLPMEVSFNEWMLSRCSGFVAVVPRRESLYQALEYRLALRMGLPTLVVIQEGGGLGSIDPDPHEFPSSWQLFWKRETQDKLQDVIDKFAKSVEVHERARADLSSIGVWRPRSTGGNLRIALLPPSEKAIEWFEVQRLLREETNHFWDILPPCNFRYAHDLVLETSQKIDLLVLDLGPRGTPRELVGYLDGLGIPQFRVCKVQNEREASTLGKYLSKKPPRPPYLQRGDESTLPIFLDGLKIDDYMEPVFFWQSVPELAERLKRLTGRIETFRSGLSPEEGGARVQLDTHHAARRYFLKRHKHIDRGNVFLSFAGDGGASRLADRLAPIIRFLDCRCFHYMDPDISTDSRLESGELVRDGLKLRVEEADVVVLLLDQAYLKSSYCMEEMQQAVKLNSDGKQELRAYAIDSDLELPEDIKNRNVFVVHRGTWADEELEQNIVEDVQNSLDTGPLRDEARKKLREWLTDDEQNSATAVRRLLEHSGVEEDELDSLGFFGTDDDWFNGILSLPRRPEKRSRARQIIALLILAVSEGNDVRRKLASSWLRDRRILGLTPRFIPAEEEVLTVCSGHTLKGLTARLSDELNVGQGLAKIFSVVFRSRHSLILDANPGSLEVPIEWTLENADNEPIALRRPIRWRLPGFKTRNCLFNELSSGALPPAVLLLALDADLITPAKEVRELKSQLDKIYNEYCWPKELIRTMECNSVKELKSRLIGCKEQVVHVAGHLGSGGLQVLSELLAPEGVADALSISDVRLMVLNGCEGGSPQSPISFEYATLMERIVRDGKVPEVVAHRGPLTDDDGMAFACKFYDCYFRKFDPSLAAFEARKAGSNNLRLLPITISQRGVDLP